MMIRGETAPLMIECGRWRGLEREQRRCVECDSGKVEDVQHWLIECDKWSEECTSQFECLSDMVQDFNNMTNEDKLFSILKQGCIMFRLSRLL